MISVFALAAALAGDAAAVTVALAMASRSRSLILRAAVWFGCFQAAMAALGALGGGWLSGWVGPWLGWVAFVVLGALGARMIAADSETQVPEVVSIGVLTSLAIATSLDALAAGVSLPVFELPIWVSVGIIGTVTFVLAGAFGLVGRALGAQFGLVTQRIGGAVLILLGVAAVFG